MKVLVIGNGAREHTLVWKIARSPLVDDVYAVPGNAGTGKLASNLDIPLTDISSIVGKARELGIGLAVVGPEAPLAAGITDLFNQTGIPVFGPSRAAARLESSKAFARDIMQRNDVPCASGKTFTSYSEAKKYIEAHDPPIVVKADGLAAGKGVTVAKTVDEALAALHSIMKDRAFGAAGDKVVIEECLLGKEVSLLAFSDGKNVIPMVPACDYKRVADDDQGPNTGGMGSYSPPGFFDQKMTGQVLKDIITPIVGAMAKEGSPYKGVLYTGLILTQQGPKVLEFNARFGDPETQVILPRLESDLVEIMLAALDGRLDRKKIEWGSDACVGVVMSSGGYPGTYRTDLPINISDRLEKDVNIFYAGAVKRDDGKIVTSGGRVLTLTATGSTLKEARERVYRNIQYVDFEGCHFRRDIAAREVT
ncbi:MAG: phosphoribosylamine--glycine ligase [Dehalococcoidia bacterium]|nr:phosphoribosylamine--glycine ligase [Dehalococcoidia bacterium]